jgi:glycosyltransferase involved in cell wall biosynthesis
LLISSEVPFPHPPNDTYTASIALANARMPTIVIVTASVIDVWLSQLNTSIEEFRHQMMGSWVFGYASALEDAGVRCVIVVASLTAVTRRHSLHPTGAEIVELPLARIVRPLARSLINQRSSGKEPRRLMAFPGRVVQRLKRGLVHALSPALFELERLFRELKPDAILVQEYESIRFDVCTKVGKKIGVPVFGTFTGATGSPRWIKPLRRRSFRRSAGLVICAESELQRVREEYSEAAPRLARIPYAVDGRIWFPVAKEEARRQLGLPLGAPVLIYHGAIDIQIKGLDILIRAFRAVREVRRDVHLVIVGSGKDHDEFGKMIAGEAAITWRAEWLHDCEELRRYLSAADLYVFPSRSDAFGISILEAMACGLPVVAGRSRGVPDIFTEGESQGGCIVPDGDANALTRALIALLSDQARLDAMSRAGLARVTSEYSLERVGALLKQFLLPSSDQ